MEHDTAASRFADAYIKGDAEERASIARECEEQGILAVLVAGRLRHAGLEEEFIGSMVRSVENGRGR